LTAFLNLQEKGLPDWVIQAQVGHVAPEMMKTYSHIRRQSLNEAAAALEPSQPVPTSPQELMPNRPMTVATKTAVMSQPTSQKRDSRGRVLNFPRENGSPHWTISATG
jgi:hypothetical protein